MPYSMPLFRPHSEAHSFILRATLSCSWNKWICCWDSSNLR